MRRVQIFIFWLFKARNNVSFFELIKFCLKPTVVALAKRYISNIEIEEPFYKVSFNPINKVLYWPKASPVDGIYQVTTETFDQTDWHYYQKEHTQIDSGERLLDVGAAEGLFALSVAQLCDKIILVEPNDYFAESLKKSFSQMADKTEIKNVAVGSVDGEISFSNESLNGRIVSDSTAGKKRIARIDTLLPNEKVTYLKADVEGFELEVLKGAENLIMRNKPKIAITTYHNENNEQEIVSLVKQFVPEYQHYSKGIIHGSGKAVMIHFWIS